MICFFFLSFLKLTIRPGAVNQDPQPNPPRHNSSSCSLAPQRLEEFRKRNMKYNLRRPCSLWPRGQTFSIAKPPSLSSSLSSSFSFVTRIFDSFLWSSTPTFTSQETMSFLSFVAKAAVGLGAAGTLVSASMYNGLSLFFSLSGIPFLDFNGQCWASWGSSSLYSGCGIP